MVAIIVISLMIVAVIFGIALYITTKSWKIVGYSYQSLFALVSLIMAIDASDGLLQVTISLIALGLLINGLVNLKLKNKGR